MNASAYHLDMSYDDSARLVMGYANVLVSLRCANQSRAATYHCCAIYFWKLYYFPVVECSRAGFFQNGPDQALFVVSEVINWVVDEDWLYSRQI